MIIHSRFDADMKRKGQDVLISWLPWSPPLVDRSFTNEICVDLDVYILTDALVGQKRSKPSDPMTVKQGQLRYDLYIPVEFFNDIM